MIGLFAGVGRSVLEFGVGTARGNVHPGCVVGVEPPARGLEVGRRLHLLRLAGLEVGRRLRLVERNFLSLSVVIYFFLDQEKQMNNLHLEWLLRWH